MIYIKSSGVGHGYQCALIISKLLILLLLFYFKLTLLPPTIGLPPVPPNQVELIESEMSYWCAKIKSPPWYFCTCWLWPRPITPSPNDDIQGQEHPSNVRPILGGGNICINRQPGNGASTITNPSPTLIQSTFNLIAESNGTSYFNPSTPDTERQDLRWQRIRSARLARIRFHRRSWLSVSGVLGLD